MEVKSLVVKSKRRFPARRKSCGLSAEKSSQVKSLAKLRWCFAKLHQLHSHLSTHTQHIHNGRRQEAQERRRRRKGRQEGQGLSLSRQGGARQISPQRIKGQGRDHCDGQDREEK